MSMCPGIMGRPGHLPETAWVWQMKMPRHMPGSFINRLGSFGMQQKRKLASKGVAMDATKALHLLGSLWVQWHTIARWIVSSWHKFLFRSQTLSNVWLSEHQVLEAKLRSWMLPTCVLVKVSSNLYCKKKPCLLAIPSHVCWLYMAAIEPQTLCLLFKSLLWLQGSMAQAWLVFILVLHLPYGFQCGRWESTKSGQTLSNEKVITPHELFSYGCPP